MGGVSNGLEKCQTEASAFWPDSDDP